VAAYAGGEAASQAATDPEPYPPLFRAADDLSLRRQKYHFQFVRGDLAFSLAAACVGCLPLLGLPLVQSITAGVAAFGFFYALLLRTVRGRRGDDRNWYDSRAVAETVKTQTWRYMMRVAPYEDDSACDEELERVLGAVLDVRPAVREALPPAIQDAPPVTDRMREVRQWPWTTRREYYGRCRLDDQVQWYERKSRVCAVAARRWSRVARILRFLMVPIALAMILVPRIGSLLGLLGALAAACLAWTEANRHDELSTTYTAAGEELQELRDLVEAAADEAALADVVRDAEVALAREHLIWVAKRTTLRPSQAKSQ
jgi:hypothetical protein